MFLKRSMSRKTRDVSVLDSMRLSRVWCRKRALKKPLTSSQGSSESDAHMAEEMGMQVEVDYENDETEVEEEVWEVFEETVDTPPELLALLMNQTRA